MGRLDRDSERLAPLTPRAVLAYAVLGVAVGLTAFGLIWAVTRITIWLLSEAAR